MRDSKAKKILFIQLQSLVTLIRANEWWAFKGAPVLATAYATASILNIPLFSLWNSLIFLLASLTVVAIYAYLLNEISDQDEDLLVGRYNGLVGRSKSFKVIAIVLCLFGGLLAIGLGGLIKLPLAFAIYISNWLVFFAYSIPPIRLKQRGILGVLADATGAHLLPNLFPVVWISNVSDREIPLLWIILVGIWSLASGLRGILWHQIKDIENDLLAGVKTFAIQTSVKTLHYFGKWIVFPIEVVSFAGMLLISGNLLAGGFLGLYLATEWLRYYFWKIHTVIVLPFANHSTILTEYYFLFYPLAFLVIAVWYNYLNVVILILHSVLYFNCLWIWCRDFYVLLRWEMPIYLNKLQKSKSNKLL